jgi:hypothetical protein
MLPTSPVPIPLPPEPLALVDTTLLFLIQVLIAQHPDLLADPTSLCPVSPLRAARHILDAIREVHYALDTYRAILPDEPGYVAHAHAERDDEIPY